MKYFILGSNSFAGSNIIHSLLSQEKSVIGISRSKEPHKILLSYSENDYIKNFRFYPYDLNQHFQEIKNLIAQEKPKVIIDLAGQGMVAESWKTPEEWYQTNIVSKAKLHNFLRNCDFLEKYIRVSTPEVYGSTSGIIDETHTYNPSTPYAVSHAAIDMSLKAFYQQYQFPMVITRFANFYGPHQQLYRIIPRTIIYALLGKTLELHGGGLSERAFIYGEDVATAIDAVIKRGKCGETYHFSSEAPISISSLVKNICEQLNIDFNAFAKTTSDRPGKDALYAMSYQKAQKDLAWSPKTNLETGIKRTIDWVVKNIDTIQTLSLQYIHKS